MVRRREAVRSPHERSDMRVPDVASLIWATSYAYRNLPRKPRDQLDVRGMAELIDRGDAFDMKSALDQDPRVAGEGRGVAGHRDHGCDLAGGELLDRSEEHTSELQSPC